jgi:LPXTG-motif cell wall-anchored protein
MNAKATVLTTFGATVALLGTLWLVQGLGLVHIGPVLCVANCEPITGKSTQWTVTGVIALLAGLVIVFAGRRRATR